MQLSTSSAAPHCFIFYCLDTRICSISSTISSSINKLHFTCSSLVYKYTAEQYLPFTFDIFSNLIRNAVCLQCSAGQDVFNRLHRLQPINLHNKRVRTIKKTTLKNVISKRLHCDVCNRFVKYL